MDSVKCPHCAKLFCNLGDRWWPDAYGTAELVVTCSHCGVDILLRRVVTVAYEAELAPDNPLELAIASAFAYWSNVLTCTLEDVTALAAWMTARQWAPTGNAGEDLLSVCAEYSGLCAREHCVNWMPLSAMGEWQDDLWALVEEDVENG